jgi:hypothetical protein
VIEDGVDILAELRGFADVHGVLRNRRDELQLSCERIDDLSGVSSGFEAGAKARDPRNAIVRLPALGLRLLLPQTRPRRREWNGGGRSGRNTSSAPASVGRGRCRRRSAASSRVAVVMPAPRR